MKRLSIVLLLLLVLVSVLGFTGTKSNKPQSLYRVYLGGKSLGLIKSKEAL